MNGLSATPTTKLTGNSPEDSISEETPNQPINDAIHWAASMSLSIPSSVEHHNSLLHNIRCLFNLHPLYPQGPLKYFRHIRI